MTHDTIPAPPEPQPRRFFADFSEGLETGLYLALLELIDEALIITGDETIIEVNGAAQRLLERDYRSLVAQPLASIFPSERAFLDARGRLFIQEQMRGSLELALPGGRRRSMRYIAAARIRPGLHALILSPDLIAEAYSPSAMTDSLWPRLAAATDQPVIVLDAEGRIRAANASTQKTLGRSREQLIGQAHESFFELTTTPTGHISLRATRQGISLPGRALEGPRPGWKLLVLTAESETESAVPPAPHPINTSRQLLAASPIPSLLCTPGGEIKWTNPAVTTALGYSALRLTRLRLADLRADKNPAFSPGVWRLRQRNGSEFDSRVVSWPTDDASGLMIFCLLMN